MRLKKITGSGNSFFGRILFTLGCIFTTKSKPKQLNISNVTSSKLNEIIEKSGQPYETVMSVFLKEKIDLEYLRLKDESEYIRTILKKILKDETIKKIESIENSNSEYSFLELVNFAIEYVCRGITGNKMMTEEKQENPSDETFH